MHQPENEAKTSILQDHQDRQNTSEKRKSAGTWKCFSSNCPGVVSKKLCKNPCASCDSCQDMGHNALSEFCRYIAINFKDFSIILH